jgi:phosphoenolpyruvate carboxykinase (GTP)
MTPTRNEILQAWVQRVATHTSPDRIHWCLGGESELQELQQRLLRDGALQALDAEAHPSCFLHRSHATDAVPDQRRRYVSTPRQEDAGPTNRWLSEQDAHRLVWPLFSHAMSGRTLYVVPYLLGQPRSKYAQVGVQLTDSPLIVLWTARLTRMGQIALRHLGRSGDFARGIHCVADLSPERRYLVHFPATQTWWSLGTDCPDAAAPLKHHVLSLTGAIAPDEGYMAEHMSVARVTTPRGARHYVAAAFPGGCGKTRLASLVPTLPDWEVELVADGACLLRAGDDGRLWAMNPAAGIDGLVGEAHPRTDPCSWLALSCEAVFTNLACNARGNVWWDGSSEPPPSGVQDWLGRPWREGSLQRAAHPGARFLLAACHWPNLSSEFYAPSGVPLSAILFGGRRSELLPLVFEATSWQQGVYVGATTRTSSGQCSTADTSTLHNDPMAMSSFCSYNMASYFAHWLSLGRRLAQPPRIFHVNWFRSDERGRLLWPGFGENIRVLKWVVERVDRDADARSTPIGFVPWSLDASGLDLTSDALDRLLEVDVQGWRSEAQASRAFLSRFGERLPRALLREQDALEQRLRAATN